MSHAHVDVFSEKITTRRVGPELEIACGRVYIRTEHVGEIEQLIHDLQAYVAAMKGSVAPATASVVMRQHAFTASAVPHSLPADLVPAFHTVQAPSGRWHGYALQGGKTVLHVDASFDTEFEARQAAEAAWEQLAAQAEAAFS